jgi:hypothetical protein
VHPDPGWVPALKFILPATFRRRRTTEIRPAIIAARAIVSSGIAVGLVILVLLASLGEVSEPDYVLTGFIVTAASLLSVIGIVRWRRTALQPRSASTDHASQFVAHANVMASLATIPQLTAFVSFFIGGGLVIAAAGVAVSLGLLLGPARPSRAMADVLAPRFQPPADPDTLWAALLVPDPDSFT